MPIELKMLAWTLVLLLVQIFLAASCRTREAGLSYNAGPRDVASRVPVGKVTGRLARAQNNLLETLPIFMGAVLILQFAQVHNATTHWAVLLYFWARVVYVPLYAFGVSYVRTVAWGVSLVGIVMLLVSVFRAAV